MLNIRTTALSHGNKLGSRQKRQIINALPWEVDVLRLAILGKLSV